MFPIVYRGWKNLKQDIKAVRLCYRGVLAKAVPLYLSFMYKSLWWWWVLKYIFVLSFKPKLNNYEEDDNRRQLQE